MKYIINESQYVYLLENLEKNKRFLKNKLGIDFTDKIQQITSTYDFPMEFDQGVSPEMVRRYLNHFGPMYLFELDGKKYIYQDRGDYDFFMDEEGFDYVDDEIPEKLGIDIIGLRFSDIIDMYFNEEDEVITEDEDNMLRKRAQRRLSFIDKHIEELSREDICQYWSEDEEGEYVNSAMINIVQQVSNEIGSYDLFDEIYEYLVNNGYRSQFRNFFIDTINNYCGK
jgi:hypothetical protein